MDIFVPGTGNEPVTNAPQNNAQKGNAPSTGNTNAPNVPKEQSLTNIPLKEPKEQPSANIPKEQKAVTNAPDSDNKRTLLREASVYLSHLAMKERERQTNMLKNKEKRTKEDDEALENAFENASRALTAMYQYQNGLDADAPVFYDYTSQRNKDVSNFAKRHSDDYYTTGIQNYNPEEILDMVFKESGRNRAYLDLPTTRYDLKGNRRIPEGFSLESLQPPAPPAPSASIPPSPNPVTNAPPPKPKKESEEEARRRIVAKTFARFGYKGPVTRDDFLPEPILREREAATPEGEASRIPIQGGIEGIMSKNGVRLSVERLNELWHENAGQGNVNHWLPGVMEALGIVGDPLGEQYGDAISRLGDVVNMSPEATQRELINLSAQGLAPEIKEEKAGLFSRFNPLSSHNREGRRAKREYKKARKEVEGMETAEYVKKHAKEENERKEKYEEDEEAWDKQSIFKKLTLRSLKERRRLDKEHDRAERLERAYDEYKDASSSDYEEAVSRQNKEKRKAVRYQRGYQTDALKSKTSLESRTQRFTETAEKAVVELGEAYNPKTGEFDPNAQLSPETTKILRAKSQKDVIRTLAQDREFQEQQGSKGALGKLKSGLGKIGGAFGRVAIAATAVVGVFKALTAFVKGQINKSFDLAPYNGRIGAAKAMFQGRQFMRDVQFAGNTADERVNLIDNWDKLMEESQEAREDFAKLAIDFAQACIEAGKALIEFYNAIKELWNWLKSIPAVAKIIESIENAAKKAKLDDGPTLRESIKGVKESKAAVKRGEDLNALINTGNLAREFYETGKINEDAFKKSTFAKKGMSQEDAMKAMNDEKQRDSFEDLIAQNDIRRGNNFFKGYKGLEGAEATKENIQEKILGVLENIDASAHQSAVENAAARKAAEETASNTREKPENNITAQPIFEAMMMGANKFAPTGTETLHAGNDTVNAWGAQAEKQYGRFAGEGTTITWGSKGGKK